MVNQLLFGETYAVVEQADEWLYIRGDWDAYEGWINARQHHGVDRQEHEKNTGADSGISTDLVAALHKSGADGPLNIVLGSTLPGISEDSFSLDGFSYHYNGPWKMMANDGDETSLVLSARKYLNAPYLWGGRSPFGIDCSGYVQMIYKLNGIALKRDAAQQATQGSIINFRSESRPGDLVFFDDDDGRIIHVGMVLDEHSIIHASGKVRVDTLDHQGIYNEDLGKYTHQLRLIKRYL